MNGQKCLGLLRMPLEVISYHSEVRSEEYERLKKEREHRKKQEATSLEETKEQIVQLEKRLTNLKDEKHMLFLTLKKVLNEDDSRRRRDDEMYGAAPQHPQEPFITILNLIFFIFIIRIFLLRRNFF